MNWLDIVLLILVAGSVISAFAKGLSRELIGFAAVGSKLVVMRLNRSMKGRW
jgi:uncharacterized membrane protein required for colicin V production